MTMNTGDNFMARTAIQSDKVWMDKNQVGQRY